MSKRAQKILSSWSLISAKKNQQQEKTSNPIDELVTGATDQADKSNGENHLSVARESLTAMLKDKRVPQQVRESLKDDYRQIEQMLEKIEHEHIHISVFGRVSVGKSSVLNALMGESIFSTSPLHGETKQTAFANWNEYQQGGVFFIDTPGINEVAGEQREKLAREVVSRSDIILFVIDGDMTDTEYQALKSIDSISKPVVLVLNKVDRYTQTEKKTLLAAIIQRVSGLVEPKNIVTSVSQPVEKYYLLVDDQGNETETSRQFPADVSALKQCLWNILAKEGKTLAAINASLFAGQLSAQVTERIMLIRKEVAEKVIRTYCVTKGVAVAINPVPVADLMAAAMVDLGLIVHLSHLYGIPLTKKEAGKLVKTIMSQMLLLMGAIWAIYLVSSTLKLSTGGFSTVLTATAEGAVAYYSTMVVGQAAQIYLKQGKSWGEGGAKQAVQSILNTLDRDSVLQQAKSDIMARLKAEF